MECEQRLHLNKNEMTSLNVTTYPGMPAETNQTGCLSSGITREFLQSPLSATADQCNTDLSQRKVSLKYTPIPHTHKTTDNYLFRIIRLHFLRLSF